MSCAPERRSAPRTTVPASDCLNHVIDEGYPMNATSVGQGSVEEVQIDGHIIDSLILPKVLDEIITRGGSFVIKDIPIEEKQSDTTHARIEVRSPPSSSLHDILGAIHDHGAVPVSPKDCTAVPADMD